MQSVNNDAASQTIRRAVAPTLGKRVILLFLFLPLGVPIVVYFRSNPVTIQAYGELEKWVGRRVEFTAVFDGADKFDDLVFIEKRPIVFVHLLGPRDWSPKTNETCKVVGTLKRYGRPVGRFGMAEFSLTDAQFFPILSEREN